MEWFLANGGMVFERAGQHLVLALIPMVLGLLNECTRLRNRGDRRSIAAFIGLAPGDQAMFGKNDEFRLWMLTHCQCYLTRQTKAGTAIGNPDEIVTEALARQRFTIGSTGEVVGSVGMRVIDMGERQKPV